jgi:hypothetical protein
MATIACGSPAPEAAVGNRWKIVAWNNLSSLLEAGLFFPARAALDDTSTAAKDKVEKLVKDGGRDKIRC